MIPKIVSLCKLGIRIYIDATPPLSVSRNAKSDSLGKAIHVKSIQTALIVY